MNIRRSIIVSSLIGSAVIILLAFGVFTAIAFFILFGEIPGTGRTLLPTTMMKLWALLLIAGILFLSKPLLPTQTVYKRYRRERAVYRRTYKKYVRRTHKWVANQQKSFALKRQSVLHR